MFTKLVNHLSFSRRYRIVAPLGKGGQGEVFEAEDVRLSRRVAIKRLPQEKRNRESVTRFRREAKALAALNHPAIVTLHDAVETFDGLNLVMELIEAARNLRTVTGEEEPPVSRIADWGVQVCGGVEAAHRSGVIHRDLKPENIMVTRDDRLKVTDFGLALLSRRVPVLTDQDTETQVSFDGFACGTPPYMSPEQLTGLDLDVTTDIYSLGVVLYELLARRHPQGNGAGLPWRIINEIPAPPSHFREHIPAALDHIVMKALEKDPASRWRSMAEMGLELGATKANSNPDARSPIGEPGTGFFLLQIPGDERCDLLRMLLEQSGLDIRSERHVMAGDNRERKMEELMLESACVVILLTASAARSEWMRSSVRMLLRRQRRICPVLMEDSAVLADLADIQPVDLRRWDGKAISEPFRSLVHQLKSLAGTR